MDIAGERVGREDPGAGAVGELEGRDAVRRLVRGRGRGGRGRGRGRRRLASPLGGRGGLLLGGLLLAGLRDHGADPGDGELGGALGWGGGGGGDREVRGRRRGTLSAQLRPASGGWPRTNTSPRWRWARWALWASDFRSLFSCGLG
jgi:hypothetical protein